MKILDRYILKKYLQTLSMMFLLFIPIGILVDLAEKIDKIINTKPPLKEIILYYVSFVAYFSNVLFPIFVFLSVIWFTSKMANNTEIISILSSGISFKRFLKPYIIGAGFVSIIVFFMGMFIVPKASQVYNTFYDKYLSTGFFNVEELYNQFSEDDYLYISSFNTEDKKGYNFSVEHFSGIHLSDKISARTIQWIDNDSVKTYRLSDYVWRKVGKENDVLIKGVELDTLFTFGIQDLMPINYAAETKNFFELNQFIKREQLKGSPNINRYLLVKYRRWGSLVTAFILTLIGVAVSSVKRRGGMGVNLAFGILIGFSYVFFDRFFGMLTEKSGFSPVMAVITPNLIFLIVAIYLLRVTRT